MSAVDASIMNIYFFDSKGNNEQRNRQFRRQYEYRYYIIEIGIQSHASKRGWGWLATNCVIAAQGSRSPRRMMNPLLCLLAALSISFAGATPLDDYVNAPDDTYRYEDMGDPYIGDGFRSHFINLTSQTWLTRERLRKRDWNESVETFYLLCKFLNCSLRRCMSFSFTFDQPEMLTDRCGGITWWSIFLTWSNSQTKRSFTSPEARIPTG